MIKIFKLVIVVALATMIGLWATKYHGYIMLVLADKTIKMNLVVFVFAAIVFLFLLIFGVRIIKLLFTFPYQLFNWLIGLFTINKQEKFADLVADISLQNNKLIDRLNISNISKITPKYLKDYILFKKLSVVVENNGIKELEKALKQVDPKSFSYKYFVVYKLYLVQKLSEAQTKILILLETKDIRLLPCIVNLAARIALADKDDAFALKLLEKYDAYLKTDLEEKLIILAMRKAKDVTKLSDIYKKSDTTDMLSRVYLEQLVELDEMTVAEKLAKKQLAHGNISAEMLKLYVNAFGMPVSRLIEKVLDKSNQDRFSVLELLNLAVVKSDSHSFRIIYDYIERSLKDKLSIIELEKYSHILCKFYIKNGEVSGLDLSEARLVYRNN
ncbi:membrane protein [Candidatus Francisella endociliophora]|uniref:Membrane protein n=1 Tax=Candidatus Francisella endociliophora TaxID=653937 RepID=A0A097ER83_9GAMM|nr:heme biosynthesis protein HemY [Francisella sp. FSC1006]AIT10052.1 membrane protein [Francisella sp. FSC1006]